MCVSRIPDLLDLLACDYIKRNDGVAKYNIVLETPRLSDRPGNDEETGKENASLRDRKRCFQ